MNSAASDPDALLVEVHAAKLLAVSTRTIQAWRRKNFGQPFVRPRRSLPAQRSVELGGHSSSWCSRRRLAKVIRIAVRKTPTSSARL